jgi:hypothetical protein
MRKVNAAYHASADKGSADKEFLKNLALNSDEKDRFGGRKKLKL